jgi:hypothetical protein
VTGKGAGTHTLLDPLPFLWPRPEGSAKVVEPNRHATLLLFLGDVDEVTGAAAGNAAGYGAVNRARLGFVFEAAVAVAARCHRTVRSPLSC